MAGCGPAIHRPLRRQGDARLKAGHDAATTGAKARYRLGVDVGGTHTDLVLFDEANGTIVVEKVSTTPRNPALGVLEGVARFLAQGIAPEAIEFFAHGTTITTNALLEMRGAKVGLLITKGSRAVQEVQSQARDTNPFDYFYDK
ncbi:MAG: hydantoinase/oxoprolinase N-terminal domain-containing protein, partial [Stellaceae bacterium]